MKATSGGKFDPDAALMYFIAGSPDRVAGETKYDKDGEAFPIAQHPNVLVAVNEITGQKELDLLDRLCDERRVLLDSGIFNLAMRHATAHDTSHDVALGLAPEEIDGFGELWDRYGQIVTRLAGRLWGVIELDQGGVANKPRIRARIEEEFGIVPMPVYHPLLDGWDYYDTIASGYDRICFGNLVKANGPTRVRLIHAASERARAYPHLWTHLLGVFPNENLLAMPLRGSCDSSSWLASERWALRSHRAWTMCKMITSYPSTMRYAPGGHRRAAALNAITAKSLQLTLNDLAGDTHPWLSPSPR